MRKKTFYPGHDGSIDFSSHRYYLWDKHASTGYIVYIFNEFPSIQKIKEKRDEYRR